MIEAAVFSLITLVLLALYATSIGLLLGRSKRDVRLGIALMSIVIFTVIFAVYFTSNQTAGSQGKCEQAEIVGNIFEGVETE